MRVLAAIAMLMTENQSLMRITTNVENCQSAEDLSKAEALTKFGLLFQKMGELELAISVYQRILDLGADGADIRYNYGAARLKQIRPTEALEQFKSALRLRPEEPGIHLGMANSHKLLGNLQSAESCLEKELEVCPESTQAAVNLGWLLEEQNRVPEALVQYRKAMYYNTNDANLRWNHGLACLMLGDYSRGWRDYEYRWEARNKQKPKLNTPQWQGEPLNGRRLLLHSEQGFGDTIMFTRFAQQLGSTNESISLQCQPQLKRLLSKQASLNNKVISKKEAVPAHDLHAPLMSLPKLMQLFRENDYCSQPYLDTNKLEIDPIPAPENPNAKRVAITWSSAPNTEISEKKSIPYSKFSRLFETPNCQFYSAQVNAEANAIADMDRRSNVSDLSSAIIDFQDTAGFLSQMDLVISVDTAVAHLAGALGVPTWTLLPFSADWRWRMHRTDSPWYPTMRLFRQPRAEHWDSVLEEVGHCLFNYGAQMSISRIAGHQLSSV